MPSAMLGSEEKAMSKAGLILTFMKLLHYGALVPNYY